MEVDERLPPLLEEKLPSGTDRLQLLAALLHAGISPAEGLELLSREEQGDLSRHLADMGRRLEEGARLSETMEAFPPRTRAMVAIGEETGRLEEALISLAEFYEERSRTNRRIRQALTYPAMLFALMLLVIGLLLTKVLKPAQLKESSDFLLGNMLLFFIPTCVSVITYADVLFRNFWSIVLISMLTTPLVFFVTGHVVQLTMKLMRKKKGEKQP